MEYNDFLDKFDAKTFEILAKEYAKNATQKAQILQKNDKNFDIFIQKYEEFLQLLMVENRQKISEKQSIYYSKKTVKMPLQNECVRRFCSLYFELKNEFYFPPSACVVGEKKALKECIKNKSKELVILSCKCLKNEHTNSLIDNVFFLIKNL